MLLYILLILYLELCIGYRLVQAEKSSILFFPVQLNYNDQLPVDLTKEFKVKVEEEGINVFESTGNTDDDCNLINDILLKDENITLVSYSTGVNNMLKVVNTYHNIDNIVMIDPILLKKSKEKFILNENIEEYINDLLELNIYSMIKSIFSEKKKECLIDLPNVNNILYISSKKSSRWKIIPPVPPIKRLFLDYNKIKNKKKTYITIPEFGHFDILDLKWSNMIHNSISRGSNNREDVDKYHKEIVKYLKDL